MRGIASMHLPARQRGIALLGLLALVSVMVIFAYVSGLNRSAAGMAQARAQQTSTALAQAKEALIAYAVTYADDTSHAKRVPGYLPCPDMGSVPEGEAASGCRSFLVSVTGRLPWKTLVLDALKDGSGECLWYAVSGTYKNNPNGVTTNTATSNMMNWDTNGQFVVVDRNGNTLAGSSTDNQAVAVIFAPGAPLPGQDRTPVTGVTTTACGGNATAAAYLDTANSINNSVVSGTASVVTQFIAGIGSDTFNDQLVYITRADLWNAIKKRSDFQNNLRALTRRAAECVAMYGGRNGSPIDPTDKRLPWASPVSLANYAVDTGYTDASNKLQGRLPFLVATSNSFTNNLLSGVSSCGYTSQELDWYEHWKDHLFYAIANNYQPSATPFAACGTCLTIEVSSSKYAAVVIFAGEKLSGQSRNATTDKALIGNYLEGRNATNAGGGSDYQALASDIVYAIDESLLVSCYDTSSSTMKPAPSTACP